MKKLHARELSRNQSILRFDVILQDDWPIEQCLLPIRVFFGGFLFIHWLIKRVTNTYRNHFSRSYENRSIIKVKRSIECFHSRGQHLCKFIGTKESVYIRKEFNSHRTSLGHQHGRRFIVLGRQYGRRDVM